MEFHDTVARTPTQAYDIAGTGLLKKAHTSVGPMLVSAMFAGALIGLGFVFYTTTQVGAGELPWGVAKALGGLVFSGGLFVVIMLGADLFTSTTMTTLPAAQGKLRVGELLRHWGLVYVGNAVGAAILVALMHFAGTAHAADGQWGAVIVQAAAGKVEHTFVEAFTLGILCNLMVCLAVWVGFAGRTAVDKFVAVLFPIPLFVATGFEHSVANMFVIPFALVTKADADPAVMDALGGAELDGLTWGAFFIDNLLPVTLGNIVGGGVMVALGMWLWHRRSAQ